MHLFQFVPIPVQNKLAGATRDHHAFYSDNLYSTFKGDK